MLISLTVDGVTASRWAGGELFFGGDSGLVFSFGTVGRSSAIFAGADVKGAPGGYTYDAPFTLTGSTVAFYPVVIGGFGGYGLESQVTLAAAAPGLNVPEPSTWGL